MFGILFVFTTANAFAYFDNETNEVGEISEAGEIYRNTGYGNQSSLINNMNNQLINNQSSILPQPTNSSVPYYSNVESHNSLGYNVNNYTNQSNLVNTLNSSLGAFSTTPTYNNLSQINNSTYPYYHNEGYGDNGYNDYGRYYNNTAQIQNNNGYQTNLNTVNSTPYYYGDSNNDFYRYNSLTNQAVAGGLPNTLSSSYTNNVTSPYYSNDFYPYGYRTNQTSSNYSSLNQYIPTNLNTNNNSVLNNQSVLNSLYNPYTSPSMNTLNNYRYNNYVGSYNMDYCSNVGGVTQCY